MPLTEPIDIDMYDGSDAPEGRNPLRATANGLVPARESSFPVKAVTQLTLATPSSDDSDDSEEDELGRLSPQRPALPYSALPTGICYDPRMRFHTELDPPKDRSDFHPEDPRRILWIYRTLCEAGLVDDPILSLKPLVAQPVKMIRVRHATKAEVLKVHYDDHFEFLKNTATKSDEFLSFIEKKFDSVYFSQSTYNASLLSAGACIDTCLAVANGEVKNAFAVIRPPGHHAESDRSMGFCHFDNVAVAAKAVREKVPDVRKVLIVDWDVHHGNGIQQAFEGDPNVLYISIHVHQNGTFYPSGDYGDHLHCGTGAGIGKNLNIPWPTKGMGDSDYLLAFQQIVMPVAFDFDPDFVIIAAGFDAAIGDPLGGCFITPACYAHMTHMLMSLANGKLVASLEGGYNLPAISASALSVVKTLMGEPPPRIPARAASKSGIETVRSVMLHQSKYWRCLYPKDASHEFDNIEGTERMHDIVRTYQSTMLAENHNMYPLSIFREKISRSFDKQVMATEHITVEDRPLLLIFHDPPEVVGKLDTFTGKLDLHSLVMSDVIKRYIAWAVEHKISVIDCNIPKFLTGISDPDGDPLLEEHKIARATEELAVYIWENYVEVSESSRVIILGVGDAYRAVLQVLNTRTWDNITQFAGAVGFVDAEQPIYPVSENFMTDFAKTYYRRSMLLVSASHSVWDPERKKTSKKFGRLVQSSTDGLSRMLAEHQPAVQRFILQKVGLAPDSPSSAAFGGHELARRVSARTRGGNGEQMLGAGLAGATEALYDRLDREAMATTMLEAQRAAEQQRPAPFRRTSGVSETRRGS